MTIPELEDTLHGVLIATIVLVLVLPFLVLYRLWKLYNDSS